MIDSPGGYVEFTVGEVNTFWIGGLSNGNGGPSYSVEGGRGCAGTENERYANRETALMLPIVFRPPLTE